VRRKSAAVSASTGSAAPAAGAHAAPARAGRAATHAATERWQRLWPLAALLALAAALRFATLDLQSLWYDEAFTPVHVLHSGLGATLRTVVHTENTPPLYYILLWAWSRVFGSGAVELRSLSAIAGLGTVAVAWAIGIELGSRRIATTLAAIVAVNPLFVWYSQEARAYILLALFGALSYLFFERARRRPEAWPLALWALFSVLALLTHYFAVFLLAPEAALLLWRAWLRRGVPVASGTRGSPGSREPVATGARTSPRRAVLLATGAVAVAGAALVPLIVSQGGHGTQWIGRWKLSSRLIAIPQYYVLGPSGSPLGHGLLLGGCLLIGAALLLWPRLARAEQDTVLVAAGVGVVAIAVPLLLALGGVDYLAPRNLIAAFVPLTAALATLLGARRSGNAGVGLAVAICIAGLAVVIDVDRSPRLQRGDWHGLARVLPAGDTARAIVTPELGSAPLEYYLPGLTRLGTGANTTAAEIDLVGYSPIRAGAARPPAPGFRLVEHRSVHGLVVYRFRADHPIAIGERALRAKRVTATRTQVLVPRG
jgi:hypothetical protein